jgi:hypothetical protein
VVSSERWFDHVTFDQLMGGGIARSYRGRWGSHQSHFSIQPIQSAREPSSLSTCRTWNPPLFDVKGKWSFDTVKTCDATQVITGISLSRELFPSSPSIVHGLSIFHFHLDIRCEAGPIHYGSWLFYDHGHADFVRNSEVSSSANHVWGL